VLLVSTVGRIRRVAIKPSHGSREGRALERSETAGCQCASTEWWSRSEARTLCSSSQRLLGQKPVVAFCDLTPCRRGHLKSGEHARTQRPFPSSRCIHLQATARSHGCRAPSQPWAVFECAQSDAVTQLAAQGHSLTQAAALAVSARLPTVNQPRLSRIQCFV